jgi:hypothetical protein
MNTLQDNFDFENWSSAGPERYYSLRERLAMAVDYMACHPKDISSRIAGASPS